MWGRTAPTGWRTPRLTAPTGTTRTCWGGTGVAATGVRGFAGAGVIAVGSRLAPRKGRIALVTADTSDLPVAEEAAVTAEAMGHRVGRIYDVGVAGLHRVLDKRKRLGR